MTTNEDILKNLKDFEDLGWMNGWDAEATFNWRKLTDNCAITYVRMRGYRIGVCRESKCYWRIDSTG